MRQMHSTFSFFKAGQGSFYGGRIWQPETSKVYTIVYDCGTSPFIKGNNKSLNDEIDYFKRMPHYLPNSNEIDLLFISHLDYDHVSGIKRLLTELKVKNIILPYIDKKNRQFFLASVSDDNGSDNNLTLEDYITFIESPGLFILQNSKDENTKIFFVKPDERKNDDNYYNNYNPDSQPENIYPRGTPAKTKGEFTGQNVEVYENNLQFFIGRYWEFTTYAKSVNDDAIQDLHNCLKRKLVIESTKNLTFDDLKKIVTEKRKEAHKCYTDCIGDINTHGLVLLHGAIRFDHLEGRIFSNCELSNFQNDYYYRRHFFDDHHFNNNNRIMLGTLLFGDTSINPDNNPVDFPQAFKDKLVNVHVVQVPHHGSSKNWNMEQFETLNIGGNFNRWGHRVVAVCNFGYGNKYGHPSHDVLNDLRSTIFLNTQFSRLNISYDFIHYRP